MLCVALVAQRGLMLLVVLERVLENADHVVEGDPTDVLAAAADDAA